MILHSQLNEFGLQSMILTAAQYGDAFMDHVRSIKNRKQYCELKINLGDTFLYAFQNRMYEMTPEFAMALKMIFLQDTAYAKNMKKFVTNRRYAALQAIVQQIHIDTVLELYHHSKEACKELSSDPLEEAHVDYTPGESNNADFFICKEEDHE